MESIGLRSHDASTQNEDPQMNVTETDYPANNYNYYGYHRFTDKAFFNQLLQEISPGFNLKGDPVSIRQQNMVFSLLTNFVCSDCVNQTRYR